MTIEELQQYKSNMFAERESLKEVYEYVEKFSGGEAIVALTVFFMTVNTIADLLKEEEKDS